MERLELKLENSDIKLEDKIILTFMKDPDIVDKDEKFFNIKSSLFLSNITYTGNDVGVVFNEHEVCIKYPKHHFYKYLCNKLIEYRAESKKNIENSYIDITSIKDKIICGYDIAFLNYTIGLYEKNIIFVIKDANYYINNLFGNNKYLHAYASNYTDKYSIGNIINSALNRDKEEKEILLNINNIDSNSKFHIVSHTICGILGDNYVLVRYGPEKSWIGRYYFFVDDGEPLLEEKKMIKDYVEKIKKSGEDNVKKYILEREKEGQELYHIYRNLGRWTLSGRDDKKLYTNLILNHTALKLLELEKLSKCGKITVLGTDNTEAAKLNHIRDGYGLNNKIYGFATGISFGTLSEFYYHYTYLRYNYKMSSGDIVTSTRDEAADNKNNEIVNKIRNKVVDGTVGQKITDYMKEHKLDIYLPGSNVIHLWTAHNKHFYEMINKKIKKSYGGGQASGFDHHIPGSIPLFIEGSFDDGKHKDYLFKVYPINYFGGFTEEKQYNDIIKKRDYKDHPSYHIDTTPIFDLKDIELDLKDISEI